MAKKGSFCACLHTHVYMFYRCFVLFTINFRIICVYFPGGPGSDFEYSTQSYTGYEPTSMRAIRARFHPFLQTRHGVKQL